MPSLDLYAAVLECLVVLDWYQNDNVLKGMAKLIHPINKISKFKINPNQSFDLIVQESPDDSMRTLNSAYGGSRISRRSESFSAPWHLSELANDFYDKFNNQMTGGLLTIVTALKIFRTSRTIQGIFMKTTSISGKTFFRCHSSLWRWKYWNGNRDNDGYCSMAACKEYNSAAAYFCLFHVSRF